MRPDPCPQCGGSADHYTLMEYEAGHPDHYDGTSELHCPCGARFGRWSKRLLAVGETEPRYGGRWAHA